MSKPRDNKVVSIRVEVLEKLLTPSELRMIQNRWEILNLLLDGLSIRKVAEKVRVGTDTVMRTAKFLEDESLRKGLVKVRMSGKQEVGRNPWIFGSTKDEE